MAAHDIRYDKNNNKMLNLLTQGSMTHKYHNTIITHPLRIHSIKKLKQTADKNFGKLLENLRLFHRGLMHVSDEVPCACS